MENTILGSRYELLERVGLGGMAAVYKAKDNLLNRFVAVKILREEFKENEDFIRRFKVESQAAACLSHQNIVQIYDVGEENGMHYIVMEFLEGDTLKKYILDKNSALPLKEAINYSMQICRALEHAHSKYVVHRDIKPQNIVITENGKLKVTDFGIARAANNTTTVNDKSSMAVGSAHYLSPEQARGGYTDHRSDIYSLGIVMYELFCGKLPFDAEESVSVLMQHLHEEPVRPTEVNPELPLGIEAIILKAMKKEQRLRYKNATEIIQDLVAVYQNPSIDVNKLNATSGDEVQPPEKETPPRPPHSHHQKKKPVQKKKKQKAVSKELIIVLSILAASLILLAIAIRPLISIFFNGTGDEVEIPNVVGIQYDDAITIVDNYSTDDVTFSIEIKNKEYSDEEPGTIISQTPVGGDHVKRDRTIAVTVSKGPVVVTLEDYSNKNFDKIKEDLEELGITVEKEEVTEPAGIEGRIHKQNPKEGTTLAEGETVTLYVYAKTEKVIVPNVIKMDKEKAIILLTERGLEVGDILEDNTSALPVDQISFQSLSADSRVPINSRINLKYSTGKNETEATSDDKKPEEVAAAPAPLKKFNIKLSGLPKDKETVRIKLVHDGKTYYERDFSTEAGNATVQIESDKSLSLDVYYDNVYITTKEVKY